jgi:hypothetical protein
MRFDKQFRRNEASMNPSLLTGLTLQGLHKRFNSYFFGTQILFVPEDALSESI